MLSGSRQPGSSEDKISVEENIIEHLVIMSLLASTQQLGMCNRAGQGLTVSFHQTKLRIFIQLGHCGKIPQPTASSEKLREKLNSYQHTSVGFLESRQTNHHIFINFYLNFNCSTSGRKAALSFLL